MIQDWLFGLAGGLLIGTASAILLLGNGRVAGISGILGQIVVNLQEMRGIAEAVAFVAGLMGMSALYTLTLGAPAITVSASGPLLLVGGLLVGFGTRLGSGCTSGHGVCGTSRASPRSLMATGIFIGVAAAVVFAMRHVGGGS